MPGPAWSADEEEGDLRCAESPEPERAETPGVRPERAERGSDVDSQVFSGGEWEGEESPRAASMSAGPPAHAAEEPPESPEPDRAETPGAQQEFAEPAPPAGPGRGSGVFESAAEELTEPPAAEPPSAEQQTAPPQPEPPLSDQRAGVADPEDAVAPEASQRAPNVGVLMADSPPPTARAIARDSEGAGPGAAPSVCQLPSCGTWWLPLRAPPAAAPARRPTAPPRAASLPARPGPFLLPSCGTWWRPRPISWRAPPAGAAAGAPRQPALLPSCGTWWFLRPPSWHEPAGGRTRTAASAATREDEEAAAARIQAIVRRRGAHREAARRRREQVEAEVAVRIQAVVRGGGARREAARRRHAALLEGAGAGAAEARREAQRQSCRRRAAAAPAEEAEEPAVQLVIPPLPDDEPAPSEAAALTPSPPRHPRSQGPSPEALRRRRPSLTYYVTLHEESVARAVQAGGATASCSSLGGTSDDRATGSTWRTPQPPARRRRLPEGVAHACSRSQLELEVASQVLRRRPGRPGRPPSKTGAPAAMAAPPAEVPVGDGGASEAVGAAGGDLAGGGDAGGGLQPDAPPAAPAAASAPLPLAELRRRRAAVALAAEAAAVARAASEAAEAAAQWSPLRGRPLEAATAQPPRPAPPGGLAALQRVRPTRPRSVFRTGGTAVVSAWDTGGSQFLSTDHHHSSQTSLATLGSEDDRARGSRSSVPAGCWSEDWAVQNAVPFRYRFPSGWPAAAPAPGAPASGAPGDGGEAEAPDEAAERGAGRRPTATSVAEDASAVAPAAPGPEAGEERVTSEGESSRRLQLPPVKSFSHAMKLRFVAPAASVLSARRVASADAPTS